MVLLITLEVLIELLDTGGEYRNLDFGRSAIGLAPTEVTDDLAL